MKNFFIHPTKRNTFYMFLVWQFLPLLSYSMVGMNWLSFLVHELVVLAVLCQWRLKPTSEMDEREIAIELKWKNRMFDWSYTCIIIPIAIVAMNPGVPGWTVVHSFVIPTVIINTALSLGLKHELGGFFYSAPK